MRDLGPRPVPGDTPEGARRAAGALESEVLAILRGASEPLSPGDVRRRLGTGQRAELSYSTVVTIMSRLHAKGLLARQRAGRGFTYTPVDEVSLAAGRMSQALGNESDHDAVLSRFVSGLSGRDARLLRQLLASDAGPPARDAGPPARDPGPPARDARAPARDPGREDDYREDDYRGEERG